MGKRMLALLAKLLSIKGLAWIAGTVAVFLGKIGFWEWLALTGLVIGGRFAEKALGLGAYAER